MKSYSPIEFMQAQLLAVIGVTAQEKTCANSLPCKRRQITLRKGANYIVIVMLLQSNQVLFIFFALCRYSDCIIPVSFLCVHDSTKMQRPPCRMLYKPLT